ncbi:hypothetical protein RHMOL_Rhmol07G0199600 [Rhododendron molle]|uniref:Uncharacterized protein n=1 Tax=Rhododendron molle TaxID=49168 RepID=A0ACC0N438_RHOML|nr:hypothetical protein RHMOL_Rhmol07G0199600 [Rhododendron molle]
MVSCDVPYPVCLPRILWSPPLMENLEVGVKEEVDGDKDANEVTKEEYLLSEENPEENETPKAEDAN